MPKVLNLPAPLTFQQDGASPHWIADVRSYLDKKPPQRWAGKLGPMAWLRRSPELTSLDLLLRGYVRDYVFL